MKTANFDAAHFRWPDRPSSRYRLAADARRALQVISQWGGFDEDAAWQGAGQQRFEAAYADEDSIYEQLIHDTPLR